MTDRAALTASFLDIVKEFKGEEFVAPAPGRDPATLHLRDDLAMDSLDLINFLFRIEEDHGVGIAGKEIEEKNLLILGNLVGHVLANR